MTLTETQWDLLHPEGRKHKYDQRRSTIDNLKKRQGCNTCGKHEDIYPLEFHHVRADNYCFAISDNIMGPWMPIFEEIKKCVVLCKACHAKRHVELHKIEGPGSRYRK